MFFKPLIKHIVRLYLRTPKPFRFLFWLVPILYFILPADLMPDFVPKIGRIDDILLLFFSYWVLERCMDMAGFQRDMHGTHKSQQTGDASLGATTVADLTPHEVLQIEPRATKTEIKKAYRKLIRKYHPDNFAYLGQDFEEAAKRRTQAIVQAYQVLSKP